jgi:DNA-binding NarL/FixJ family response regulator
MTQQITVLIADDQPRACQGLRALLATWPPAAIAGEARDGREAVSMAYETRPDVALLDVLMPGMTGIEATTQIKARCPDTRVVLLSIYADCEEQALAAGADAFLSKADAPQLLLPLLVRLLGLSG